MVPALRQFCLVLVLVLTAIPAIINAGEEASPRLTEMETLLQEAIDSYQLKQYTASRAKLDALLAQDPTNEEAYRLVEIVGAAILSDMAASVQEFRDLGRAPIEVLLRSRTHEQSLLLEEEHIKTVVQQALIGDRSAMVELQAIGEYAVGELVNYLTDRSAQDKRINAIYLLTSLSTKAVSPLLEALKTDDGIQRQNILQVLNGIRPANPRIIAPVKLIYETEKLDVIKNWAAQTLKTVTGQEPDTLKPAIDYYYMEANRYYLESRDVEVEMDILNETLWSWNKEDQKLTYLRVPRFALPSALCERYIYESFELEPKDKRFLILVASLYLKQKAEVEGINLSLQRNSVARPDMTTAADITATWNEHIRKNAEIASTVGPDLMLGVLLKAMADGKADVAVTAINQLEVTAAWDNIAQWTPGGTVMKTMPDEPKTMPDGEPVVEKPKTTEGPFKAPDGGPAVPPQDKFGTVSEAGSPGHPLRMALRFPNRRIRIAAANCLVRIGYPASAPDYNELLPILLDGAMEDAPEVVLIVSSNVELRENLSTLLTAKGMQVLIAPDGREGAIRATEWPPKDVIFVDGTMAEFEQIQTRLEMIQMAPRSPLPLTIITTEAHARILAQELSKGDAYRVEIMSKRQADEPKLFEQIAQVRDYGASTGVVLITNENAMERARIKQTLSQQAENLLNPGAARQMSKMMEKSGATGLVSTYVNIFLDEDLSGFDAMRTVHALQQDSRSRPVPVAILTNDRNHNDLQDRFAELTKKPGVKLVNANQNAAGMVAVVRELGKHNELADKNYIREQSFQTAIRSADSLSDLRLDLTGIDLNRDQVEAIKTALEVRADVEVRIRLAHVLGHFRARHAESLLVRIAGEQADPQLKATCLRAVGRIDTAGRQHEFKLKMLDEATEKVVQEAAAWALALEQIPGSEKVAAMKVLRVGLPDEPLPAKQTPAQAQADQPTSEPVENTPTETTTTTTTPEKPADTGFGSGWGEPETKTEEPAAEPEEKAEEKPAEKEETTTNTDGDGWGGW